MPEWRGFFKIVHPDIFEYGVFFFSVLAFRPHINGVFGHQKRRFSKNTSITQLSKGCYSIFVIVLAFSSGQVKTSQSAMKTEEFSGSPDTEDRALALNISFRANFWTRVLFS